MTLFFRITEHAMEAIAAVTASIYARKWKNTIWKWFTYYLVFVVVADYFGEYLGICKTQLSLRLNLIWYDNIVIPAEFLFFFWMFYQHYKPTRYKWLTLATALIYICSLAIAIFYYLPYFRNETFIFYTFNYSIGNILLLLLILFYFVQIVTTDSVLKLSENMLFWVSAGLMVYYLGSCPYWALYNTLTAKSHRSFMTGYSYVVSVLDSLMYLVFTLSIIWVKPPSSIRS